LNIARREHFADQLVGKGALTRFHMAETLTVSHEAG
jgi:hypothetical protein